MTRLKLAALVAVATVALSVAFAPSAFAHPTYTQKCSDCHGGTKLSVIATPVSNNGTTAVYNVSAPNADAIALFKGTTKMSAVYGTSRQISVTPGSTYTIIAIKGPGTGDGMGSTSVSPTVPKPADTTAPVTTSDAVPTYLGTATIMLSATDNAGGSGVAHTYYAFDSGAQHEGTVATTSAVGPHSLEFWSVDTSGNVETPHKTASFSITAPVAGDTTAPVTTSDATATYVTTATISLSATDNAGGSGIATTFYRLDGAVRVEGTSIVTTVPGSHTIEFWSEDLSANVETPHNFATFNVTTAYSLSRTAPSAASLKYKRKSGKAKFKLSAKLVSTPGKVAVGGTKVALQTRKKTSGKWTTLYTLTTSAKGAVSKTITKTAKGITYYRWSVGKTVTHTAATTGSQKVTIK